MDSASATAGQEGGLLSRAFLALCCIYFLDSFLCAPFQALFPVYIEADLARPPWFTGYLRGLMLLLSGVFAVVAGRLCDRFGRKTTLMLGLVGSALTGLVFRTADPWGLSCLLLVLGAANGPWATAGQSILIAAVSPARLGLGAALYFLSNTLGNALGSFCTGLVKTTYSFAELGAAMSIGMVAVIALAFALLPGDAPAPPAAQTTRLNTWTAYRPLLRRGTVHLLLSLRLTITTFWGMATLALPLLIYRVGESAALPAYFAAASLAVAACCQLGIGYLNDRLGRTAPLLGAAFGVFLSALGLALWHDSLGGLFAFGTALTGTAWAVSTLIPRLINDVAAPAEKNRLVGLGHLAWSSSMVAGSLLGGYLVEIHAALPFYLGAALAALGVVGAAALCRRLDDAGVTT